MKLASMIGIYDTWNPKYDTNEFIYETETDIRGQSSDSLLGRHAWHLCLELGSLGKDSEMEIYDQLFIGTTFIRR